METEDWAAIKAINQARRQNRRKRSGDVADAASRLATEKGLVFIQCSDIHYQIGIRGSWLLNVWPSTGKILSDPHRPCAPYVELPDEWTILDVVKGLAAEETNGD